MREIIVAELWRRGLVEPVALKDVLHVEGAPVLYGSFGMRKGSERSVRLQDGSDAHVLRLIMNVTPSSLM